MHYLYRQYDIAGKLLYVGITNRLSNRTGQHRKGSSWGPLIARITADVYQNKKDAALAEIKAIENEKPTYNIQYVDVWSGPSTMASLRVPDDMLIKIDAFAVKHSMSRSQAMITAFNKYFK